MSEPLSFNDFVNQSTPHTPYLPLVHTCDAHTFRKIIRGARALEPRPCTVFAMESLLYLFYGRPAYRPGLAEPVEQVAFFPVCFILETAAINGIVRIAPFDTGAFVGGIYNRGQRHFHAEMKVNDFLLDRTIDAAGRVVSAFFDSNENYYSGRPKKDVTAPGMSFEVESYMSLLTARGGGGYDDRRGTVEVQVDQPIQLSAATLRGLVLPDALLAGSPDVSALLKNTWGVRLFEYQHQRCQPSEFVADIRNAVRTFCKDENLLV